MIVHSGEGPVTLPTSSFPKGILIFNNPGCDYFAQAQLELGRWQLCSLEISRQYHLNNKRLNPDSEHRVMQYISITYVCTVKPLIGLVSFWINLIENIRQAL